MAYLFTAGRFQGFDNTGLALAGGLVYTYAAGTTTPLATYTNQGGGTPNANPVVLDSSGRASIWLSSVAYRIIVKTSGGTTITDDDNIIGSAADVLTQLANSANGYGADLVGGGWRVVNNIAAVRALSKTGCGRAFALGGTTAGDGAGGPYYYVSTDTTSSDNGSTILLAADGGRWYLDYAQILTVPNLVPTASVGGGTRYVLATRASGQPQYGLDLVQYQVTAALGSSAFEVVSTAWATATNLAGGALFGGWQGANTPNPTETFSGGAVVGSEINAGNRWADFGIQTDVGGTRYTVGLQVVPDVIPAPDTYQVAVTFQNAAGSLQCNWTSHGFSAGQPIQFTTAGGAGVLPTGVTSGTAGTAGTYYVIATGLAAGSFQFSSSIGGAAVAYTNSGTPTIYGIPSFPGSFGLMVAPSVHAHRWWVGLFIRPGTVMPSGHVAQWWGGAAASANVPLDALNLQGYFTNMMDFSSASITGSTFLFNSSMTAATATAGGGQAALATVLGYITAKVGATSVKIPYFAN
jgi:hypothetical protein